MDRKLGAGLVAFLLAGAASAAAQTGPGTAEIQDLAFMAGCWRGDAGPGRHILERYGPLTENLMLGTTLFLQGQRAVMHELIEVARLDDGRIRMTPYPNGDESPDPFFLTALEENAATFEAPEHDYPKRIRYRLLDDDRLQATIDGGADDPDPGTWTMRRVRCEPDAGEAGS